MSAAVLLGAAANLRGVTTRICSKQHAAFFPFCFFSKHIIRVQVVQPYSSTDTATARKNLISLSLIVNTICIYKTERDGSVSLFNGIPTFMGYLKPNLSF